MAASHFFVNLSGTGCLSIVDRSYQCINRGTDDILINTCSPGKRSIWFADSHISDSLGG